MSDHLSIPCSQYADLTRDELARLVRELLLIGQLIDRSGMAWCISAFGREQMAQIAIEEWGCASPVYTRRMQRALGFVGDDVPTIFKGLQLDIGAPHQFLDFRFKVLDARHGEFWLDHCGALADVAPMGEDYVRAMCHDIEDPTFDATAVATHRRAQIRPLHRPPYDAPRGGKVCHWTIVIADEHPEAQDLPGLAAIEASVAASTALAPIDPTDEGHADYTGPVMSDFPAEDFSRSALVRIADELCLQMQLLDLSFAQAVRARAADAEQLTSILRKQLVGIAGVAAARLRSSLGLGSDQTAALEVLRLLPMLGPTAYVDARVEDGALVVRRSPAHDDGGWLGLLGPGWTAALNAAVHAVDPRFSVEVSGDADEWRAAVVVGEARPVADEVAVTRFSTGVAWEFEPRRALPLTVV
ncbi:hypothetical protein [Nocardioides rubriscoriae]|uniref:hypothetical protein n=1 Tax=Nocardioides rubriscoriae TaxID=642762 RepID=UPI001FE3D805|nr:hypothetical protein [Nocardioides rubriscoriae]